jgi:hypothetical protein
MIEATYTGPERVELNGAVHTGPNAEGNLARALIGAGVDPGEAIEFCRGGMAQLRGTVAAFAGRAWRGADADPQFRRWRPHPKGDYPDLLLRWHALRPVGRPGGAGAPAATTKASGMHPRTIPPVPSPEQFLQPANA